VGYTHASTSERSSLHPHPNHGHRCGSRALKQEYFCYFRTRMIKGVQTRVDSKIHPVTLIETPKPSGRHHAYDRCRTQRHHRQQARQHRSESPPHRGKNSRNVYFHIRPDDTIREVPNYAEQYLTEHPELNPPEPAQANSPEPAPSNPKKAATEPCNGSDCVAAASESHNSSHRVAATAVKPAAERRPPWEQKQKIQLRRSDRKVAISTSGQNAAR
jgi:hypothetical protein